jgi:hypothetical protein
MLGCPVVSGGLLEAVFLAESTQSEIAKSATAEIADHVQRDAMGKRQIAGMANRCRLAARYRR